MKNYLVTSVNMEEMQTEMKAFSTLDESIEHARKQCRGEDSNLPYEGALASIFFFDGNETKEIGRFGGCDFFNDGYHEFVEGRENVYISGGECMSSEDGEFDEEM